MTKTKMIMKRQLLFLEHVMYGDGQTPFNGVFHIRLKGSFTAEAMRHALNGVQAKHDMLRVAVTTDTKGRPWFVSNPAAPEIPLDIRERLTNDDWITATKHGWQTLFPVSTGPLAKLVWLRSDNLSDLLLVFHHCLCDGASAVAIVQELLLLLEQPDAAIGQDKMVPPVHHWAAQHLKRPFQHHLKGIAAGFFGRAFCYAGALLLSRKKTLTIPREKDYLLHWKLDKAQSAALLNYCKAQNVTVNTALSLAWLRAYHAVKNIPRFKITCPVDVRKFVTEIKNDTIFSFGVSIRFAFDRDNSTAFWQKARRMQQDATRQLKNIRAYNLLLQMEYLHGIVKPMQQIFKHGDIKHDFMFSNMGPLPIRQQYRSFEVEAINSPTVIGPFGNPTTIITTTYKGQMDFGFVSNGSIITEEEALQIKEKAMAMLLQDIPVIVTRHNLSLQDAPA